MTLISSHDSRLRAETIEEMTPPIVLVLFSGWSDDEQVHWFAAKRFFRPRLRSHMGGAICSPPLDTRGSTVADLSAQAEEILQRMHKIEPRGRLCVFAHSTGCLFGRSAVRRFTTSFGGDIRCVWAGAPWKGTPVARLAPGITARDILPGIPREDPAPIDGVRELSLIAEYDIVVPSGSDFLQVETSRFAVDHGALVWTKKPLSAVWEFFTRK